MIVVTRLHSCSILSIGPTLEVNAEASATFDLDVGLTVGVNYQVENAEFVFPKGGGNGGTFTPGDTRMSLLFSLNLPPLFPVR